MPYTEPTLGHILISARTNSASDVFLWTLTHELASVGRPSRTYLHLLCADTGRSLKDLLGAMGDRDGGKKRVKGICAVSVT